MRLKKELVREMSLFDVRAWYKGESEEFKKWTGFGFLNTLFVSRNNLVTVYYDQEEVKKFNEVLDKKLDEEFFDNICNDFFELIESAKGVEDGKTIFDISTKCWPALMIFDEISKYPEWADENMLHRLTRVRQTTQDFYYNLSKKVNTLKMMKDYLFFKGELLRKPFEELIQEQGLVIED